MSMTTQFPCPQCAAPYTKASNTNRARSGFEARRQRTCLQCRAGFVTYEIRAADYALLQSMRQYMADTQARPPVICEAA